SRRGRLAWPFAALWSGCGATRNSGGVLNGGKKLAARDYASGFPCRRKMLQIAGNKVVGTRCLRAFQEQVVFRIGADQKARLRRKNDEGTFNCLDNLSLGTLAQSEFRSRENFGVFPQNRSRSVGSEFSV